jgi:hypothetical protein
VVAGAANLAVAVAKAVAGLLTGSAAMQAEAAHSVADTATEVFLLVAAGRGSRAPDAEHPFGHGRETYLWAFLAALATFVAGAGVSCTAGRRHRPPGAGQSLTDRRAGPLAAATGGAANGDRVAARRGGRAGLRRDRDRAGDLLVAAKVNFADEFTAADIERVADRAPRSDCATGSPACGTSSSTRPRPGTASHIDHVGVRGSILFVRLLPRCHAPW